MKKHIALLLFIALAVPLAAQDYLEVPTIKKGTGTDTFITTFMEQNGETVRSFTYRYDTNNRIALWVAYPLNASLIGTGSRGEGWQPDPNLPESTQAILYKGFRFGSGFDRGHQIPSADRLDAKANEQTFRFTNATPQLHDFNGGIWAELEKHVRTWAKRSDTLYVVTGVIPGDNFIEDNSGNPVNIPSVYYKVMLRRNTTKSGFIQWSTCAVLLPHEVAPVRTWKEDAAFFRQCGLPINELEKKTGEHYFPNLAKYVNKETLQKLRNNPPDEWWWK